MKARTACLATILCVVGFLSASAVEPLLHENQNFYSARATLLRDGWMPVETFRTDPDGYEGKLHSWGDAKPYYRSGLKEVESCTGVDADYCDFNYRRKDRCFSMRTAGEYNPPGSPYVPTVVAWWSYPLPATGGCSADAADKLPTHNKFDRHSFP